MDSCIYTEKQDDGWIVKPINITGVKINSIIIQKCDGPSEWFTDMPVKILSYIGPSNDCEIVITMHHPIPPTLHIKELFGDLKIECVLPGIESIFKNCKFTGYVNSSVYDKKFLYENRICSYFGKDYMGF